VTEKFGFIDAEYADAPGSDTGGAPTMTQMCE
jgi:hypothetical protein